MATEKRLIDAYALMDCIRDSKRHNPHDDPTVAKNHMFEHDHFMKMVSLAPTVDAVEVVRCKECKHYDNSEGICWCHLNSKFYPGGFDWHSFPEDGFCSYGERKDNG